MRDIFLAYRNLRRNVRRTLAATGTVIFGVVALLLAGGFITWTIDAGREAAIHSQYGHAQIVKPGFFESGLADPYNFLLLTESIELNAINNLPDVMRTAPRLVISGLISHEETTLAFAGEGIDPPNEKLISSSINIISGQDLQIADERKILLGEGLANSLNVTPGDKVVLLVTTPSGSPNAIEVVVAGIFMTAIKSYDDYAVRLPIVWAHKLMRLPSGATSIVILLNNTGQTEPFVREARNLLPANQFEVVSWHDLADFQNKTEELFTKQVKVVKVIIGMIIILTISNTLVICVFERTAEIGTYLALGLRKSGIVRLFILEGILIGGLGGSIGVVMGNLLALVISSIGIPMPPAPGMAHGFVAHITITPQLSFEALLLAIIATLLASISPAWKAGRMNIVDALRYSQ